MGATRTELVVDGPVIVGAGLAGLSCAIELAPAPCLVVSAGEIGAGTSEIRRMLIGRELFAETM